MVDEYKIRLAKLSDAKGIADVFRVGLRTKKFKYTGTNKYTDNKFKKLKENLQSTNKSYGNRFFVAVDSDCRKILGSCSYDFRSDGRQRHKVSLGWSVHPDYFGRGIGTKIVEFAIRDAKKRGFKRAEAEVAILNVGSWKLAQKLGFKIEGVKKKDLLLDNGKYDDIYIMGKLL